MSSFLTKIQMKLKTAGFYGGPIDGLCSNEAIDALDAAIEKIQRDHTAGTGNADVHAISVYGKQMPSEEALQVACFVADYLGGISVEDVLILMSLNTEGTFALNRCVSGWRNRYGLLFTEIDVSRAGGTVDDLVGKMSTAEGTIDLLKRKYKNSRGLVMTGSDLFATTVVCAVTALHPGSSVAFNRSSFLRTYPELSAYCNQSPVVTKDECWNAINAYVKIEFQKMKVSIKK